VQFLFCWHVLEAPQTFRDDDDDDDDGDDDFRDIFDLRYFPYKNSPSLSSLLAIFIITGSTVVSTCCKGCCVDHL